MTTLAQLTSHFPEHLELLGGLDSLARRVKPILLVIWMSWPKKLPVLFLSWYRTDQKPQSAITSVGMSAIMFAMEYPDPKSSMDVMNPSS